MLRKIRSARWRKEQANASMNSNFCVRWPQRIASGADKIEDAESGNRKGFRFAGGSIQSAIRSPDSEIEMSRTSIIALLIFGAILGYFLSFGAGHHAQVPVERLSIARAILDQRLRAAKTDHSGAHRVEIAR